MIAAAAKAAAAAPTANGQPGNPPSGSTVQ